MPPSSPTLSLPHHAPDPWVIEAICRGQHDAPFSVLGLQGAGKFQCVRAWIPYATAVSLIDAMGTVILELAQVDKRGFFSSLVPDRSNPFPYRLRVSWPGTQLDLEDPYRFGPILGSHDLWLLAEGTHKEAYRVLGAHRRQIEGVWGCSFAVWAVNAKRVAVVGDFNGWDNRRHPMRRRAECGVWEIFLPGVEEGACYKFDILDWSGKHTLKADPYALRSELRPNTASMVSHLPDWAPMPEGNRNRFDAPISIYEVHLGSWRRRKDDPGIWLTYRELAETLIPYVVDMGFTHIELLPIFEFPYDGSWGYQPTSLFAPTARFGSPDDFAYLVQAAHNAGLGVLLDWVPGHFPADTHGLARFDGTHLYEHADPREGFHRDWNTLIYNYGRPEVSNYLAANCLFWIRRYGVDGLRMDAVASMLYRDYSRPHDEWVRNKYGGRENLEAIRFLQTVNHWIGVDCPGAMSLAEESTAFPGVTHPPEVGGLGFHFKWNLGWMHDTLRYMQRRPEHRSYHQDELTFSRTYAFSENYVLPLSHDEVVHGKGSLLAKMPGDATQQFANLRACYGYMWACPGKKLLFMGGEFAQRREWNFDIALDWELLEEPLHQGMQRLVRELNRLYRTLPALHTLDCREGGFEWIDCSDTHNAVLSFLRHDGQGNKVLVVCHFAHVALQAYRIGVPCVGTWREVLNTDSVYYGGSNIGTPAADSEAVPAHGHAQSILLSLAPLATQFFVVEPLRAGAGKTPGGRRSSKRK